MLFRMMKVIIGFVVFVLGIGAGLNLSFSSFEEKPKLDTSIDVNDPVVKNTFKLEPVTYMTTAVSGFASSRGGGSCGG